MNPLTYGYSTDTGMVRSHNEDTLRTEPSLGLWLVADGMGGHRGGEKASALAADFIVQEIRAGNLLAPSLAKAHHAIKQATREGKGPEGMGTTVVALQMHDSQYEIAWVGDCRAYLWDGTSLKQLTKDHSYVQHLVDTGVIASGESASHPYQDVLMQALGATDIDNVNVEKITRTFHKNEQILLCSDGLTKELADPDIAAILASNLNEQEKVDALIRRAIKNGGRDNVTVVLISAGIDSPAKNPETDTVPIPSQKTPDGRFFSILRNFLKKISGRC